MPRGNAPRPSVGEQTTLDLGLEPPVGRCAFCGGQIRRNQGVTVQRPYRFGVCAVSLHRSCRFEIGAEGIVAIVLERERRLARMLGVDAASDSPGGFS